MSEITHEWFAEQIATYLADGLCGDELERFRSHAGECRQCAALLESAEESDGNLRNLFGGVEPSCGFEDRLIQSLRQSQGGRLAGPWRLPRLPNHPRLFRAAAAVAAVLAVATAGYVATNIMAEKSGKAERVKVASNLNQIGEAMLMYADDGQAVSQGAAPQSVNSLTTDSRRDIVQGNWQGALHDLNEISAREPGNDYAQGMRQFVEDKAALQDQGQSGENYTQQLNQAEEHQIPYNDIMRYPRTSAALANGLQGNLNAAGGQGSVDQYDDNGAAAVRKWANSDNHAMLPSAGRTTPLSPVTGTDSFLLPTQQDESGGGAGRRGEAAPVDAGYTFTGGGQVTSGPLVVGNGSAASTWSGKPDYRIRRSDDVYFRPAADVPGAGEANKISVAGSNVYDRADTGLGAATGGGRSVETEAVPSPPQTPAGGSSQSQSQSQTQSQSAVAGREIVRHGQMSFTVDSFDSAFLQIQKITAEEGGFISAASSDRLANGKVSGSVTVRLPPENLDVLVLKLRALGDLTGEKIVSDDVTKEYTDLQSELRADQAMEDRILEIIKTGKGQVKDLLAAENQAGVWREKVEKITGEINYYNNLISLSTLEISLTERDIRQSATATETESVSMGIEANDVVSARAEALKSIDIHHGRVTDSQLRQLDAGEFAATIEASVPPDDAGPLLDNLRQIGHVARLEMSRQQTTVNNQPVVSGAHLEREESEFQISIYNLANVQPRQTENIAMACQDVETVYHRVIARVLAAGGRIVQADLNRASARQIDGSIDFETPADQADAVLTDLRGLGEVMNLTATENPDAANVTSAKRGFALTLASFAEIAPRQSISVTILPGEKVADAYAAIQSAAAAAGASVTTAQLQEQQSQSTSGTLVFSLPVAQQAQIEKALAAAVGVTGREINRQAVTSDDLQHTLASKVQYTITLASADQLSPRESTDETLAVADVASAYNAILAAAQRGDSKITAANLDQSNPQAPVGRLDLIVPRAAVASVDSAIYAAKPGVIARNVARSADLSNTTDEKSELQLVLVAVDQLPPRETITLDVLVSDPQGASSNLQAAALAAGGRVMNQTMQLGDGQRPESHLEIQVPLKDGPKFIDQLRDSGTLQSIDQTKNDQLPDADFTQARLDITFNQQNSLWATVQSGLSTSIRGLLYSLEFVVIGVCLILPLASAIYGVARIVRRVRGKSSGARVSSGG